MQPKLLNGKSYTDSRGSLSFNNNLDLSSVRRMYFIENININFVRGWQGHKIEKRWFNAVRGSFKIQLIKIDDWIRPTKNLTKEVFILTSKTLDVFYIPNGYVSSIQALQLKSKLLVMSDYLLGEIKDEYRYDLDYFNN